MVLAYLTIFMKTNDLINKNHDMYENRGTYRICQGFEENSGLLAPKRVLNCCRSGAMDRGNKPTTGYPRMLLKTNVEKSRPEDMRLCV